MFEAGSLDTEDDEKQYKSDYERVQTKIAKYSVETTKSESTPSSGNPIDSLPSNSLIETKMTS